MASEWRRCVFAYTIILYVYIQTKWMGKSHGRDASLPYRYICMYNITTTLFFGMYTVYTDVCGDLGRAYDWYVYTLAPRRTRIYTLYIYSLCAWSPSGLCPRFWGWVAAGGGAWWLMALRRNHDPAPSPLTQCAQGFSPSRACLSSRLVDIYAPKMAAIPLHYI